METKTVTAVQNAQVDTAQKKFGTGSLLLDGNDDELTTPDNSAWDLGTGKFTIDCWIRLSNGHTNVICGQLENSNNWYGFVCSGGASGTVGFGSLTNESWDVNFTIPAVINDDTWYHVEVVRDGTTEGTWHCFIDGVEGTKTLHVGAYNGTIVSLNGNFKIGTLDGNYALDYEGWIDELRFSKGIARHTSNFTPETSEYSTDDDTDLLLHMNGTDGSTDFVDSSAEVIKKANFFFAT